MNIRHIARWPRLYECAKHIAYDNGMVNRFEPEDVALPDMLSQSLRVHGEAALDAAELELKPLDENQVYELCTGGDDPDDHGTYSDNLEDVLDALFEDPTDYDDGETQ